MATTAERRLRPKEVRRFGSLRQPHQIPDLTQIQTRQLRKLSPVRHPARRSARTRGSRACCAEIFPIESYDKNLRLEYIRYELGKPRYEPDECRQLRLTYGRPFRVWLRLTKEEPIEEEVYLGDMPIMLGGGEFIINGAERVVVSQLHRSPGVDFVADTDSGERKLHSCRIIPERGSWIELNISKKDTLSVRIDQSGKFSAMTLLRAMDPKYSRDPDLLRIFYPATTEKIVDGRSAAKIEGKIAVEDIVYPAGSEKAGEIILEVGPEDHQERRRTDYHLRADVGRSDARRQSSADSEQPGRRQHRQPRRSAAADLPAAASRQSAAVGKGQSPVPRKILRHQPLSLGPRRPVPHQPQAEARYPGNGNDAPARGFDRRDQVSAGD